MTNITTRSAVGRPLTYSEMDGNFNNLNSGKAEVSVTDGLTQTTTLLAQRVTSVSQELDLFSQNSGASLIGFVQDGIGAVMSSVQDKLRDTVSVLDFMTEEQRVDVIAGAHNVDVSAAVQKAIDHCLINGKDLVVDGLCRIDTPINIDRAVDTTTDEFRICGRNSKAGFYTAQPISIFTSSLPGFVDGGAASENIVFDNLRFEASVNTVNCFALDGNAFLRIRVRRCYFRKIRLAYTSNFFQSWYFEGCQIRKLRGIFMEAGVSGTSYAGLDGFGFDLHFSGMICEDGDPTQSAFLKLAGNYNGGSISNFLYEGCTGPFFEAAGGGTVAVSGGYFEAVNVSCFKLGAMLTFSLTGVRFGTGTDPTYWPVDCQTSYTVVSQGCFSEGNLFKSSGMQTTKALNDAGFYNAAAKGLLSFGDVAYNGLVSDDLQHAQQIDKIRSRTLFMGLQDFSQGAVTQNVARMSADGVSGSIPTSSFNWYAVPGFRGACRLEVKVEDSASGELPDATMALTAQGQELYSPTGDVVSSVTSGEPAFPFVQRLATTTDVNSQGGTFLQCKGGASTRLLVYGNGGIGSYQANNVNLSDARTKKEIMALPSYWDKWKALEFVTFRYNDQEDPRPNIGLIAQQVEVAAPEFVSNDGFDPTQKATGQDPLKTIFTTDLYHAMGKVLQEVQTRLEQLEQQLKTPTTT